MAGSRVVELAARTFERGLADRTKRPGVADWVERLHAAADQTVRCRGCAGTYFVLAQRCRMFCITARSGYTRGRCAGSFCAPSRAWGYARN